MSLHTPSLPLSHSTHKSPVFHIINDEDKPFNEIVTRTIKLTAEKSGQKIVTLLYTPPDHLTLIKLFDERSCCRDMLQHDKCRFLLLQ